MKLLCCLDFVLQPAQICSLGKLLVVVLIAGLCFMVYRLGSSKGFGDFLFDCLQFGQAVYSFAVVWASLQFC